MEYVGVFERDGRAVLSTWTVDIPDALRPLRGKVAEENALAAFVMALARHPIDVRGVVKFEWFPGALNSRGGGELVLRVRRGYVTYPPVCGEGNTQQEALLKICDALATMEEIPIPIEAGMALRQWADALTSNDPW